MVHSRVGIGRHHLLLLCASPSVPLDNEIIQIKDHNPQLGSRSGVLTHYQRGNAHQGLNDDGGEEFSRWVKEVRMAEDQAVGVEHSIPVGLVLKQNLPRQVVPSLETSWHNRRKDV